MKTVRDTWDFLGSKLRFYIYATLFMSFSAYISELAFAYSILLFLIKMDFTHQNLPESLIFFESLGFQGVIAVIAGATFLKGFAWWYNQYTSLAMEHLFRHVHRSRLVESLMGGSGVSHSESLSLFENDCTSSSILIRACMRFIVEATLALAYFGTLLFISYKATLLAVLAFGVVFFPLGRFFKTVKKRGTSLTKDWKNVNKNVLLAFQNIFFLTVAGRVEKTKEETLNSLEDFVNHHTRFHMISSLVVVVPQVVGILILLSISLVASGQGWIHGGLVVPFFYLFMRFIYSVSNASGMASEVTFRWESLRRIFSWWKDTYQKEQREPKVEKDVPDFEEALSWNVKGINYKYREEDRNVINDLNIIFKEGEAVVVTGPSGSGKSTLLKILLGVLRPNEGQVMISSGSAVEDVYEVRKTLWKACGYVGAESYMNWRNNSRKPSIRNEPCTHRKRNRRMSYGIGESVCTQS